MVEEEVELPLRVSWPGGQGMAMEAVSTEVTGVLWDSHHTNGVWFSLKDVFVPSPLKKGPLKMSAIRVASFPCWMKQPTGTE